MTDEPELRSLIDDVRCGREAAFAQLIEQVQLRVRAWAVRFTDDSDAADDIAQEVLIGLQRSVQHYQGHSRFTTWLYSVTRNTAREHRRSDQRRSTLRAEQGEPDTVAAGMDDAHDARTVADLVLVYFDALPPKQRQVFELVDLRGMEPTDVARQLGMRPVTVRAHLFKARRSIRARMLQLHEPLMTEFLS